MGLVDEILKCELETPIVIHINNTLFEEEIYILRKNESLELIYDENEKSLTIRGHSLQGTKNFMCNDRFVVVPEEVKYLNLFVPFKKLAKIFEYRVGYGDVKKYLSSIGHWSLGANFEETLEQDMNPKNNLRLERKFV